MRHLLSVFRRISVVAVDHDVAIGADFQKCLADGIAFALLVTMAYYRASSFCDGAAVIGGIIVIDENFSVRQRNAKISNNLGNCGGFVVARDDTDKSTK
jgi:hypothetical protein